MLENSSNSSLQENYKRLSKKQKSAILEEMLAKTEMGRQWLLKYLSGAYKQRGLNEFIEKIGIEAFKKLDIKLLETDKNARKPLSKTTKKQVLIDSSLEIIENLTEIFEQSLDFDVNKSNATWVTFGFLAARLLLNPFQILVEIMKKQAHQKVSKEKVPNELKIIFEKGFSMKEILSARMLWDEFRLKSSRKYAKNPFVVSQNLFLLKH